MVLPVRWRLPIQVVVINNTNYMNLKIIKMPMASLHPCKVFINDKQVKIDNNLNVNLSLINSKKEIYLKSYWFKSNKIEIEKNHSLGIIYLDIIIGFKKWLVLMFIFFGLFFLNNIYECELFNNLLVYFSIILILFFLYIYTIGYKNYLKIKIEYLD